jgi:hypothetical protein
MKSLNIADAIKYLGEDKHVASLENDWYRRQLHIIGDGPTKSDRIGRFLDPAPIQFSALFLSIADWLPKNSHRLLWIDHFAGDFPSQTRHFLNKGLSLLVRSAYMLTRRRTSRLWLERRPGSVLSAMLSYGWRLLWGTRAFRPAVQRNRDMSRDRDQHRSRAACRTRCACVAVGSSGTRIRPDNVADGVF